MQETAITQANKHAAGLTPQGTPPTLIKEDYFMPANDVLEAPISHQEEQQGNKDTASKQEQEVKQQLKNIEVIAQKLEQSGEDGKVLAKKLREDAEKAKKKSIDEFESGFLLKLIKSVFIILASLIKDGEAYQAQQLRPVAEVLTGEAKSRGEEVAGHIYQPEKVVKNAALSPEERKQQALEELQKVSPGKEYSKEQQDAILKAHIVGSVLDSQGNEIGREEGKRGEAGVYNYTQEQLLEKARILKEAGFTKDERRLLMEAGITGVLTAQEEQALQTEPKLNQILTFIKQKEQQQVLTIPDLKRYETQIEDSMLEGTLGTREGNDAVAALLQAERRLSVEQAATATETTGQRARRGQRVEDPRITELDNRMLELMQDFDNPRSQAQLPLLAEQKEQLMEQIGRSNEASGSRNPDLKQDVERELRRSTADSIRKRLDSVTQGHDLLTNEALTQDKVVEYMSFVKRYVGMVVKNEKEGNITDMDVAKRNELRAFHKQDLDELSEAEIKEAATKLSDYNVDKYFGDHVELPESSGRGGMPDSLTGLMKLIMENDSPEYRDGQKKALLDSNNEVQYHNLLDWLRSRIVAEHTKNPDDNINVFKDVDLPTFYQNITFDRMINNPKFANKKEIKIEGNDNDIASLKAKDEIVRDQQWWGTERNTLLTEAFMFSTSHNWDVGYKNSRGEFGNLGKLMKEIFGRNVLTKDKRLFKVIGLPGRSKKEYEGFGENLEQGSVGRAIQRELAAFNHLAELVTDDANIEGENQFKKALGPEGMKTFWLTLAEQAINSKVQFDGKERVQGAYKQFVKDTLIKERDTLSQAAGFETSGVARKIDDAIQDVEDKDAKEFQVQFQEMKELYDIRLQAHKILHKKNATIEEEIEIKKQIRGEIEEGMRTRVAPSLIDAYGPGNQAPEKRLNQADIQALASGDLEKFGLAVLGKIRNIEKNDLNIFNAKNLEGFNYDIVKASVNKAASLDLGLDEDEAKYADIWASSMTTWGGIAAKNDVGAKAFDSFSRIANTEYYRARQDENRRPGNVQNIPYYKHLGMGILDFLAVKGEGEAKFDKLNFMDIVENRGEDGNVGDLGSKINLRYDFKSDQEKHYGEVYIQNVIDFFNIIYKPESAHIHWEKLLSLDKDGTLLVDSVEEEKLWQILKALRYMENEDMLYDNKIRTFDFDYKRDKDGNIEHDEYGIAKTVKRFKTVTRREHIFGKNVRDMNVMSREDKKDQKEKMARRAFAAFIEADLKERRMPDSVQPDYSYDFIQLIPRFFQQKGRKVEYNLDGSVEFVETGDPYFDKKEMEEILKKAKSDYVNMGLGADVVNFSSAFFLLFPGMFKQFFKSVFSMK